MLIMIKTRTPPKRQTTWNDFPLMLKDKSLTFKHLLDLRTIVPPEKCKVSPKYIGIY